MFSLDDLAISYPHAVVQRVPSLWNVIYAGIIPLVIIVLWAAAFRPGLHQAHVTILGLFISIFLTHFLTDVTKNAVGRPRPDLIARCKPEKGTPLHTLVTIDVCTETDPHTLQDGWRSFPSGHSSFAFSGLGYLALFFAGQMYIFHPRTDLARCLLALAPLIGAALIAISRLADYRHDVYDVTTGSLLGMLIAYFSYRRYYPSLRMHRCDEPYPSRAAITKAGGIGRLRDEERGAQEFDLGDLEEDEEATLPLNNSTIQQQPRDPV